MNQKNQAASEGWPEDRADWPQTANVIQGGVSPVASVVVSDRESADLESAVRNVISKMEQKTGSRPDLVVTKHRHAVFPREPFGYFRAEPFGWTDCAETDEGAVALYDQETVNTLQGRCDELQKQRDALRTALEEAIEYLEPRVEGGKVGVNLLPRLKSVIASVEGGESPTNYDGWISVLDRLPEKAGLYAVYLARTEYGGINKDGSVGKVEYDWWRSHHWEPESAWGYWELGEEDWQWSTTKNPDRIGTIITHWQPAPQPPANAPKAPLTDAERDKIIAALKAARNRGEK